MTGNIAPRIAALVICVSIAVIACIEARGLWVGENPPPHVLTTVECTSCHSDPASLRKMKWKEGNMHIFFHGPDKTDIKLESIKPYTADSGWAHK